MSVYRDSPAEDLRALGVRLRSMAPLLAMPSRRAASSLSRSLDRLRHDATLTERVAMTSGLSAAMVRWAIETTLETADEESLHSLSTSAPWLGGGSPARLCSVVLAGNVFTGCVRALVLPLLFGVPVLARTSARDDALARALVESLEPPFSDAITLVSYPRSDHARLIASLEHSEVVHIYGADETVRSVREGAPPHAVVVPHGHGVGVGFVDLRQCEPSQAADALAIDVGAYDQRGCLSPHVVYVVGDAASFAEELASSLQELGHRLPRGVVPDAVLASQVQWRGTVAALGVLHEGADFAVGLEQKSPLPIGPGWRHIVVRPVADDVEFLDRIRPLGAHLKAVGVAGESPQSVGRILAHAPGLWPRVCRLGRMQTPPFDLAPDGLPPWHGLVRVLETR